jgi:hypothetical protein
VNVFIMVFGGASTSSATTMRQYDYTHLMWRPFACMSMLEDSRLDLIDGKDIITNYLIKALQEINPGAPTVFGIDGLEAGPEEVVLKIVTRLTDSLQSHLLATYMLRHAADIMYREGLVELLPELLRLQELADL